MSIQPVKSTTASQALPSKHFWSRDLVSSRDLGPREVETVLNLAALMKARPADFSKSLAGKMMVMFFEKASLRTRLTFEAGMASLGGSTFFIDQTQERLGARETLADVAHNVERWVNAIVLRTYASGNHRADGRLRVDSGDQRTERAGTSLPGAGRLLHPAGAVRRPEEHHDLHT